MKELKTTERAQDILNLTNTYELIDSTGDYDTCLCSDTCGNYCIVMITYEYNTPQINYKTQWYDTKEKAIQFYKDDMQ